MKHDQHTYSLHQNASNTMKVIVNNHNVSETRHKEVEEKQIISDVWTHFSAGQCVSFITTGDECYEKFASRQLLTNVKHKIVRCKRDRAYV